MLSGRFHDEPAPRRVVLFRRDEGFVGFPLNAIAPLLELAYAITVHKSQGSEYERVALILPDEDTPLLSREILYTAITRAKEGVVLVGDEAGLERALGNDRDARRNTTLAQRIQFFAGQDASAREAAQ